MPPLDAAPDKWQSARLRPVCLSYFSTMIQCFSLTTFQHKLNFSISEHDGTWRGISSYAPTAYFWIAWMAVVRDNDPDECANIWGHGWSGAWCNLSVQAVTGEVLLFLCFLFCHTCMHLISDDIFFCLIRFVEKPWLKILFVDLLWKKNTVRSLK